MKKFIIKILIMIASAFLLFYIMLPAINIHDYKFYYYILFLLLELALLNLPDGISQLRYSSILTVLKTSLTSNILKIVGILIILSSVYVISCDIIFTPLFMSKRFSSRINVETVEFSEIPSYNFNETAIIDRLSANKLGDKVMGEMIDLVSQFYVSDEYSQISYKEGTYRVTPLAYDGFVKYIRNRGEGIPGYIIVNTTTGETKLNRLDKKMKYVPSAYLFEDLFRKLRFNHPFSIFGDPTFEIDEDGNPYYVCTVYTYNGIHSLRKVIGVILFNPCDGTSTYYDINEAPTWTDRIYPESLVVEEINDYGRYRNGFLNSIIGQEGLIQTSRGYNYISKDGDIWLYSGMTSVSGDSSNIGFVLVNLRNHEAQYIATSGADEYSVMASAEGEVLNYGYTATFPVLINLQNKPFYLLSLKDSAELIKMYALVDAQDYQQVYTCKADKDSKSAIEQLVLSAVSNKEDIHDTFSVEKTTVNVLDVANATIDGNSYVYLQTDKGIFVIKVDSINATDVLFIKVDDILSLEYYVNGGMNIVKSIEK